MRAKLSEFRENGYLAGISENGFVAMTSGGGRISDRTAKYAIAICLLEARIKAVDEAFEFIPEKYRPGIREKIMNGGEWDYITASINTWKKWQQVFVFGVAENLGLI